MKRSDVASRIIWSADTDVGRVGQLLDDGLPFDYIKFDRFFLEKYGLWRIAWANDRGTKVFADTKIVEIPSKVEEIAKLHLRYKPWMLNVMAGVCSTGVWQAPDRNQIDGLKRFADLCHTAGTLPCAVTVLTSKSAALVEREFSNQVIDQVLIYVEMLLDAGFTDIVCSPLEAAAIRRDSRFSKMRLNTPGVRLPDSATSDQARVMTPVAALAAGVDRLVIGRDLTNDPIGNYEKIVANIMGGKDD